VACLQLYHYFLFLLSTAIVFNFLKVPKREIFDRSDFPDFYTIKSLRVGDFGVKIKKIYKIFRGSFRGAKFLMRMLSVFSRRFFF
jgi:hypothetical protein